MALGWRSSKNFLGCNEKSSQCQIENLISIFFFREFQAFDLYRCCSAVQNHGFILGIIYQTCTLSTFLTAEKLGPGLHFSQGSLYFSYLLFCAVYHMKQMI